MPSLIAGNWKMNGFRADGLALAKGIRAKVDRKPVDRKVPLPEILICPPATLISEISAVLQGSPIPLGGQDCHAAEAGAHTGDLSAAMLKDAGCAYVIIGHSERRIAHRETDELVRLKAARALSYGLRPIICVGESEIERREGIARDVIRHQIDDSVPWAAAVGTMVLAYEPIWAIGTGRTPTLSEIAEMHRFIDDQIAERLGIDHGVRTLYGGSVKRENATKILAVPFVGGALVGGASLNLDEFWAIVKAGRPRR